MRHNGALPAMTTTETHPTADRERTPNRVSRVRLARELIRSEGLRSIWPRLLGRVFYRRVVVAAVGFGFIRGRRFGGGGFQFQCRAHRYFLK